MKLNGKSDHKVFMKAIFLTKSKRRTLLIKRKVRQINDTDNNDNLSESFNESFDCRNALSGDNSAVENDDKDIIEKDEINKIKNHQYSFSKLPDSHLIQLNFEDLDLNRWVLALHEREILGAFNYEDSWTV